MHIVMRSAAVTLFAGGVLALGVGAAHAEGPGSSGGSDQTQSGLLGGVLNTVGHLASGGAAPRAASTPTTASSSANSAAQPHCACDLTLGSPKVNLHAAAVKGAASAPAGSPAKLSLLVTNTGNGTVTGLKVVRRGAAPLDCGTGSLAIGASTTCTTSITPVGGDNTGTIDVSGTGSDGDAVTAAVTYHVTGTAPATTASKPISPADPGTDGSGTDGSGTPQATAGSGSTDKPHCHCDLTLGTPKVAGTPAAVKGKASAPAGKPTTLTLKVTNTGDGTVNALKVTRSGHALDCATTSLAVGASTTCTDSITPTVGDQSGTLDVTGTSPEGGDVNARVTYYVTGTTSGDTTSTSPTTGTGDNSGNPANPTGTDNGSNPGDTQPGTAGSTTPTSPTSPDNGTGTTTPTTTQGDTGTGIPGLSLPGLSGLSLPGLTGTSGSTDPVSSLLSGVTSSLTALPQQLTSTLGSLTSGTPLSSLLGGLTPDARAATPAAETAPASGTTASGTPTGTTGSTSTGTPAGSTPASGTTGSTTGGTTGSPTGSTPTAATGGTTGGTTAGTDPTSPKGGQTGDTKVVSTGVPTVNGSPAGDAQSAPSITTGQPAALAVPVTNVGSSPVSALKATGPAGALTCGDTTLAVGQSTVCTGQLVAGKGLEAGTVTVSGKSAGKPFTVTRGVFARGVPSTATPAAYTVPTSHLDSGITSGVSGLSSGVNTGLNTGVNTGLTTGLGTGIPGLGSTGIPGLTSAGNALSSANAPFAVPTGAVGAGGGGTARATDDHRTPLALLLLGLAGVAMAAGAMGRRRGPTS